MFTAKINVKHVNRFVEAAMRVVSQITGVEVRRGHLSYNLVLDELLFGCHADTPSFEFRSVRSDLGYLRYSLIKTAKLNGVGQYLLLCCVLARLPDGEEYRFLLPWSIPKESLNDFESGRLA